MFYFPSFFRLPIILVLAISSSAHADRLLSQLAIKAVECTQQPFSFNQVGHKRYQPIESHCADLIISGDRAEFRLDGHSYTLVVKENENSDGGDLNDVYLQYDSREDQEVLIQQAVLAFNDPIVGLLITAGIELDKLPEVPLTIF
ncbi:hypothetical protein WDW37_11245 [Bdellovibrionota bacterium FG-1]